MMIRKQTSALLIITLVLALTIILKSTPRTNSIYQHNTTLYPNMLKKLTRVASVNIQGYNHSLLFRKNNLAGWEIVSNANFPARINLINDLLLGVAYLKIIEQKTQNQKLYCLLDLEDAQSKPSNAIAITLKDQNNKVLANLLVGKKKTITNFTGSTEQIYVRKKGQDQCWLVEGNLPTSLEFKDWVQQPLLPITAEDINKISIANDKIKTPIAISKAVGTNKFVLDPTSVNGKNKPIIIQQNNALLYLLTKLENLDALPFQDFSATWQASVKITLDIVDGSHINLEFAKINQHCFARVLVHPHDANKAIPGNNKLEYLVDANDKWIFQIAEEIFDLTCSSEQDLIKALKL